MKDLVLKWIAKFYNLGEISDLVTLLNQPEYLWHSVGWTTMLLIGIILLSMLIWWTTKELFISIMTAFAKKTKTLFDDLLVENKFFNIVAHLIPLLFLDYFLSIAFFLYPKIYDITERLNEVLIAIVILIAIKKFLNTFGDFLKDKKFFIGKPIKSYVQTINIVLTLFFVVIILSLVTGQTPVFFLTSLGAMTAIIILIFKDTILGFVGSIQMAANDMVRVGDWITMEKYDADGDVIEISLNTVKVQNWDMTITTIPTYSFISESFKNWRGMSDSGGRRISRNINIQISTIKFATPELIEKLKNIHFLKDFVIQREEQIKKYNIENHLRDDQITARKQTNIGLFRKYLTFYLKNHKSIHQDMTLMVRQLPPSELGVPIQVYCFTKTTNWIEYEGIMCDIFDHIFAVIKEFELHIHEAPTGEDLKTMVPFLSQTKKA